MRLGMRMAMVEVGVRWHLSIANDLRDGGGGFGHDLIIYIVLSSCGFSVCHELAQVFARTENSGRF